MDIFSEELSKGIAFAPGKISKESIAVKAKEVSDEVMEGNMCPLETYIKAKAVSDVAAGICKTIKDSAIDEANKYGADDKVLGVGFATKSTPTQYDFSDDAEWVLLNDKITQLKAQQKEIEGKMILAMNYAEMVDDTGVVIVPARVKKDGSTTIQINIPRE